MVRAFARVARERPNVRLVMCGDGSLRRALAQQAQQFGVDSRVEFRGHVPRAAMPDVYRSATVMCVTSRHEAQSMAAVEAAACGIPVVGFGVGVLPDLGDGAVTVTPGDEAGLVLKLAGLLDDGGLAKRIGRAARAVAELGYDLRHTTSRFAQLYDDPRDAQRAVDQ